MTQSESVEILVIGGGQAGLVMGRILTERGHSVLIADSGPEVGHSWRSRWESLKLFTASQYNGLPGMAFPAAPDTYAGKDEVADFLKSYADRFDLPVRLGTTVRRLSRFEDGRYRAETTTGPLDADKVVVATGPFQVPVIPSISGGLDPTVTQLHSTAYKVPEDLPNGRILIVGAANSGQQIALELSASRKVDIAVGQKLPTLPQRPFGRDLWWWLTTTRIARISVSSRLGQRLSQRDVVIGGGLRELRRHEVGVRPRVVSADGREVTFESGETADYDGIVWATGFRVDHSWIDIAEVKDEAGHMRHTRGVTESPGLYLLGMTWQHRRTSALLGWVAEDAAFLADQIHPSQPGLVSPRPTTTTSRPMEEAGAHHT